MSTKEEKRAAAFQRMSAEERKNAEEKAQRRAEKKATAAAKAAEESVYKPSMTEIISAKKKFLKELALYFKAVQLGKTEYNPTMLEAMKKELSVENYNIFREEYIDIIRTAFHFRTPVYTHPVKTEAANFLDAVMTRYKEAEWGLILGLLTEGYVSKTLANLLKKHADLLLPTALGGFTYSFLKGIKDRGGNLEEDDTVSPFTEGQKKRIEELLTLYRPASYGTDFHEVE